MAKQQAPLTKLRNQGILDIPLELGYALQDVSYDFRLVKPDTYRIEGNRGFSIELIITRPNDTSYFRIWHEDMYVTGAGWLDFHAKFWKILFLAYVQ